MSFWDSFVILLDLGVLYLLALFSSRIVLLGLLAGPPLGGCLFLVMLLIWLLLMLVLCGRLLLMVLVRRFTGLVVLVLDRKEFVWGIPVFPFLITRGGVLIRMMGEKILLRSGLGLGNSLGFVQAHVSRFARFQLACSCMQA